MAKNSLFAILLRSHWGVSFGIAAVLILLALALMPKDYRVIGALSAFPFIVIGGLAAWRQRNAPSAARLEQTAQALNVMTWPACATLLEQAFTRDGYTVKRRTGNIVDFELERRGRKMVVAAKRWKAAKAGLEPLRELQAARESSEAEDALWIGLGELTETARPFAAEHRIAVWQLAEIAEALQGLPLDTAKRP